jgi:hypothetical protein
MKRPCNLKKSSIRLLEKAMVPEEENLYIKEVQTWKLKEESRKTDETFQPFAMWI